MHPVKRGYHAPVRDEQAAATRRRIVDAAVAEFTERSWSGATVAAIAARAGVTPQAVYLAVGPKPALLVRAVEAAVAGDSAEVALARRPAFHDVYAEGVSVRRRLDAFAAATADVYARAAPLFVALQDAARTDEVAQALDTEAGERRMDDHRRLAALLAPDAAAEQVETLGQTIWVLAGPVVYLDAVQRWQWSAEQYRDWLATLLRDAAKRARAGG